MISSYLSLALAFSTIWLSGSANPLQQRGAYSVSAQKNPHYVRNGPKALAHAYRKYGIPVPVHLSEAAKNSTGSPKAIDKTAISEYVVSVGINGQFVPLQFDSGSSDLFTFSTLQPTSQTKGHAVFNPSVAPDYVAEKGETFAITYGDGGGASGVVGNAPTTIGGLLVDFQGVELAQTVSPDFTAAYGQSGIVGFAFPGINTGSPRKVHTFMQNAIPSLKLPVFTAYLPFGKNGTFGLGQIDSSKHSGSITYAPVDKTNGYWGVTSSGYAIGSGAVVSTQIDAVIDTGTSLLQLTPTVTKAFYAKVAGSQNSDADGGYVYPCKSALPSITLALGAYKAVILGSTFQDYGDGTCYGAFQSSGDETQHVLGDIFFNSQFVVFDQSNPARLGFAPLI